MKLCKPEYVGGSGPKHITCRACGVPFTGRFEITADELAQIGGRLDRIYRPCRASGSLPKRWRPEPPRIAIDRPPREPAAPKIDYTKCVHRGELLRSELCASCTGTVAIKVFRCALHGICQLSGLLGGVPTCGDCDDFSEQAAARQRS